ncbi:MAG: MarR family winged helix-turn-helix transcriptional regulator [Acidimicrobiales bacterium]
MVSLRRFPSASTALSDPPPEAGSGLVPQPVRIGRALARLSRLLEQASHGAGLSLAQYRVLVFVAERPQRASALATKVDVRRATLSAIVSGLERAGLLRRVAVEGDGRGVQLQLTPAGRAVLVEAEESLARHLSQVMTAGGVEAAGLVERLEAMLVGFEAMCA